MRILRTKSRPTSTEAEAEIRAAIESWTRMLPSYQTDSKPYFRVQGMINGLEIALDLVTGNHRIPE